MNGATIRVTDVQPARDFISLSRQDFAVTFDYVLPLGRRMDILVQPSYSGPGTCRWAGAPQPGIVAGSGSHTIRFQFSGTECSSKTLTAVSFRVAPEGEDTNWQLREHALSYRMQ